MANSFSGNNRPRRSGNRVVTKSGRELQVNRSLSEKWTARREAKSYRKSERLRGLPKSRLKRLAWRLNPRRQAEYWFSRDGGIMLLKIAGIGILILFVLTLGVFAYFRKDLPDIKDISGSNLGGSISYYDRTGSTLLFEDYNAVKRVPVQSDAISGYLKAATVATEDRNFYKERGFDVRGIARATVNDVTHQGGLQGGSTITQQLVKLTQDWTNQRSITRKAKELILAVELERTYTKDEILTGYLNAAPYGGVDYGAQAAASDYFHKDAKDLTLPEAAMLAAIPKSPDAYSKYSPDFDQKAFADRYNYVLDSMVQTGRLSKTDAENAKKVDVLAEIQPQQAKYAGIKAPYYVLAAKNELTQKFFPSDKNNGSAKVGGWKVITALDLNLQNQADQIVSNNLYNVTHRTAGLADEEATVLENVPTGQIEALVGGVDFNNPNYGQINFADSTLVAPGSSFKPYDYVSLINDNNNVGAGSVMYDSDGPLPGYPCTVKGGSSKNPGNCLSDYDFLQPGPITLRYALGGSRNIPAEKAMMEAVPGDKSAGYLSSINKTISTASAMMDNTYLQSINQKTYNCYQQGVDINSPDAVHKQTQCYNSSAIGDGAFLHIDDHVNGLSTMARQGQAIPRTFIMKITNASNKTIYQYKQPKPTQVVKQDAAYIVDNMASDPNASYLPGSCSPITCTKLSSGGYKFHHDNGWNIAVKTGTTNSGFDGLMAAWDTQFAVVSWVGNHTRNVDISSRTGTAMEYLTEPLTRGMIEAANATIPKPVNWTPPADIKTAPAFVVRNHIHYGDIEPSPSNDLFPSWYVGKSASTTNTSQTIDKVSGKVATSCTPAAAKQTAANANALSWNIDIFKGGSPSSGSGSSNKNSNAANPTDDVHNCSDVPPNIHLTATDNANGTATLTAFVSAGTHPFNDPQYAQFPGTVSFTVNGQNVGSKPANDPQDNVSVSFTVPSTGSYTVSATVTDSVLYSATDSTTANFTSPVGTPPATTPNPGNGGTDHKPGGGQGAGPIPTGPPL